MKKVFVTHPFAKEADLRSSQLKDLLIIAYRKQDTLYIQNIESHPKESMDIKFDPGSGLVQLQFKLENTHFLALGDKAGLAKKVEIKKK